MMSNFVFSVGGSSPAKVSYSPTNNSRTKYLLNGPFPRSNHGLLSSTSPAHVVCAAFKYAHKKEHGIDIDINPFFTHYIYTQDEEFINWQYDVSQEGTFISKSGKRIAIPHTFSATNSLITHGVCSNADFVVTESSIIANNGFIPPDKNHINIASRNRVTNFVDIRRNVTDIKNALKQHQRLIPLTLPCNFSHSNTKLNSDFRIKGRYNMPDDSEIDTPNGTISGNVFGYDDNIQNYQNYLTMDANDKVTNTPYPISKGAFYILNSVESNYGISSIFTCPYDLLTPTSNRYINLNTIKFAINPEEQEEKEKEEDEIIRIIKNVSMSSKYHSPVSSIDGIDSNFYLTGTNRPQAKYHKILYKNKR